MRQVQRPLSIVLLALCGGSAQAVTLSPSWEGGPMTSYSSYTFTTSSRTAPPEAFSNPHGVSTLLVEDEQFFGTGWQDPNGDFQLTRVPGEGAWDLGMSGKMSITIPIAPPGDFSPKELEVFVNLIWYLGPVNTPNFAIGNHTPSNQSFESELVQSDGAGSWRRTVWQASFEAIESDSITLVLQAPSNGSVIDAVTVHTMIPEPSSAVFAIASGLAFFFRRRRDE
jgi:hypothetical protein